MCKPLPSVPRIEIRVFGKANVRLRGHRTGFGGGSALLSAQADSRTYGDRNFNPRDKGQEPPHVRLWRLSLDLPPDELTTLAQTLSPDEAARATHFRLAPDRDRFIAGRGLLRGLLAHELGRTPGQIVFQYGPHGKPALAGTDGRLRFSLSHTGDVVLVVLALGRDVGVDIERVRSDVDADSLARRFLPVEDAAFVLSLPSAERTGAFFRAWVRHEVYLKALSIGFAAPAPPPFGDAL